MKFALWAVCLGIATAYPTGPPVNTEVCRTMFPSGHNASAQTSEPPFEFQVEGACYKAGQDVSVRLLLKNGVDTYFEGLFVQARVPGQDITSHGTFNPGDDDSLKAFSCANNGHALSQSKKAHYKCKNFMWTPPANPPVKIQFIAAVVHETDEFWMNVASSELQLNNNCPSVPGVSCPAPANVGVRCSWGTPLAWSLVLASLLLYSFK